MEKSKNAHTHVYTYENESLLELRNEINYELGSIFTNGGIVKGVEYSTATQGGYNIVYSAMIIWESEIWL